MTTSVRGQGSALSMYVVGPSGAGKSTILNALLSDWMPLLPQGGVGSFTSSPVRIRFSDEPYLAVRRHRDIDELLDALANVSEGAAVQEARLLVQGTQHGAADARYLLGTLRAAREGEISATAHETDRGRLAVLADVLPQCSAGKWMRWPAATQLPELRHELENNAAGFLSPLATEIELGWSAAFLSHGLELVDLPGLGVAHDMLQARTIAMVGAARAVMVVVNRSGLTDAVARLLRPLLSQLVSASSLATPRILVVATQLDQEANDRRAKESKNGRRSWQAHFDEIRHAIEALVRVQIGQQLDSVGLRGDGMRTQRDAIAASIPVLAVAPLEHRRFHRRDPEDPSWVMDEGGAGIMRLRQELASIAETSTAPHPDARGSPNWR